MIGHETSSTEGVCMFVLCVDVAFLLVQIGWMVKPVALFRNPNKHFASRYVRDWCGRRWLVGRCRWRGRGRDALQLNMEWISLYWVQIGASVHQASHLQHDGV